MKTKIFFILLLSWCSFNYTIYAQFLQPMEIIALQTDGIPKNYLCSNSSDVFVNKYHDFYNKDLSFWMPHTSK